MMYLIFFCIINAVFSSVLPRNEQLDSFTHSIETTEDHNKIKQENLVTTLTDIDDSYQDQIQNGFQQQDHERRIFDWINSIISGNVSDRAIPRATEPNREASNIIKNFREVEHNLTTTLTKLKHVLTQILNIIKYTRHGHFKTLNNAIKTAYHDKNRYKRNLNETIKEEKEVLNNTKEEKSEKETVESKDKDLQKDGRRMQGNPFVSNEVKERLLHYINEGFDEIKSKIESLQQTKNTFSNNSSYKIGYIIANLDSLDSNMRKLNGHLDVNKQLWNDTEILRLYDTVKASTTAVNNLMDVVKKYLNSNTN